MKAFRRRAGFPAVRQPCSRTRVLRPASRARRCSSTDTNKGSSIKQRRARTSAREQFSIDFWFYPGQRYEFNPEQTVHQSAARPQSQERRRRRESGYRLQLEDGNLWLYLAHSPPADMIALQDARRLCRSKSGRTSRSPTTARAEQPAPGFILNGDALKSTSTMTPRRAASCRQELHAAVDLPRRELRARGSAKRRRSTAASTSCGSSSKALTPLEVGLPRRIRTRSRVPAQTCCKTQLTEFVVAPTPGSWRPQQTLDEAREVENEIADTDATGARDG